MSRQAIADEHAVKQYRYVEALGSAAPDSGRLGGKGASENPALADLFGLNPPLLRPLDRERLAALGFGVAILHKDRRRARPAREPDDLFDAPLDARVVALNLFSGHKFQTLRQQLERACGSPIAEDGEIAIFDLTRAPDK